MTRRYKIVAVTLVGPTLITLFFFVAVLGSLHMLGIDFSREQIKAGALLHLSMWQLTAFWWMVKNWKC